MVGENPFPIVGVGASAGGIDALTRLIGALPRRPGLALVVVQHLDPHHDSHLTGILRNLSSSLEVVDAEHGIKVAQDHAYVIQPNTSVAIADGVLSVTPRPDDRRPHYPVDHFLRSLAAVQGPRSVGVILSGTGSDGTLGICEIKAAGGITFAQDLRTAQHDGMPHSAVASGSVDLVLPPEEIARQLAELPAHPYLNLSNPARAVPDEGAEFQRVITALRHSSGVDFSQYRDTTIRRRTARRMLLRGFKSAGDYAQLLERDPSEAEALYRDVLINVTSFFREPEMFEELKQVVFPEILRRKEEDSEPIRMWVPGCSTGQEAYSLAITLLEFLASVGSKREIQIFATDLGDPTFLDRARNGVYPESIESEVSPERLKAFFVKEGHNYRIGKRVRDLCVFARQNITVDPPFSRVDLVSCRNVLIYMSAELQERLLPVFHFALNHDGYLVLGAAETVGSHVGLFDVTSSAHKIYRRRESATRAQFTFVANQWLPRLPAKPDGKPRPPPDFQREADRLTANRYAPPSVLVNEELEVQQFRGRSAPFLEAPSGQPTTNLLRMARAGVVVELRSALTEAKATRAPVVREHLHVSDGGRDVEFTLRILPVTVGSATSVNLLVLFEPQDWPMWSPSVVGSPEGDDDAAWLRQELEASREYLQSIVDAGETANQELRAAHEELLSSNEELQSTNEELETTKEELQSANEELTTVNEQFQTRNRELDVLTDDLSNFIGSADVPMVTVNRDLSIRRLTPAARRAFNVLATDIGRSIDHIKFSLAVDDIGTMIESVIGSGQASEREVQDRDGRWWMLRVRPYLTGDNRVDGATLVAVDVESIKRHHDLLEARNYALSIVQTVREPLVVLDPDCRVGLANEAFYTLFGETPAEVEGRALWEIGRGVWNDPALQRLIESASAGKEAIAGFEIQRVLPSMGLRTLVLNGRPVSRVGRPGLLLLAIDDVTDARQAEHLRVDAETLRLVDRRKDEFLGILAHELRNPLAPMQFAVEMLRRSAGTLAETDRARQVLERQIAHMVRIVDDLLDVSRITQGKVELRKVLLRLSDIVHSAVELSRPALDAVQHTLTVSLPDEVVVINGDPVRLTQVLVNLLNNAIKFTPPGGHIWLIAERTGEVPERPNQVRIRVRDTGIGIAPEMRNQVFDMFMQGDRSLERTRGGLGVGLTLVRSLVALHGGRVDAWSDGIGCGSEFVVSLPIESSVEETSPVEGPKPSAHARTLRVVVADDNEDAREMLKYLLTMEGHTVVTAADGDEAFRAMTASHPDVGVLDVSMPGLNGYSLARKLREHASTSSAFLIALSGLGQPEDKASAIAAGFDHHFTKPVEMNSLLRLLAERFP